MEKSYYKWTKGEPYKKSLKTEKKELTATPETSTTYENMSDFKNLNLHYQDGYTRNSNKRSETNKKMIERKLIAQVNTNPYMTENNYLTALTEEDLYLRPKSSNTKN